MKWLLFFEITFRAVAFSFVATAISAAALPFTLETYALKVFGCIAGAVLWWKAEDERRERHRRLDAAGVNS